MEQFGRPKPKRKEHSAFQQRTHWFPDYLLPEQEQISLLMGSVHCDVLFSFYDVQLRLVRCFEDLDAVSPVKEQLAAHKTVELFFNGLFAHRSNLGNIFTF